MRYLGLSLFVLGLSMRALFAQLGGYTDLNVTGTATINLLQVNGESAFAAGMGVGPGSSDNIADFGAQFWVAGPDSYNTPSGANLAIIGSCDDYPEGFVFKLMPDDYGDNYPALLSNWIGYGPLPLILNTYNAGGYPVSDAVLVGTYDWDGQSMFQVQGQATFTGPVEIMQAQGDISMGNFQGMPGGGDSDDARSAGGFGNSNAMGGRSFGGGVISGTSGLSGTSGN